MIVDTNGFMIYHPQASNQYKHIIQVEPDIATDLINQDIMIQSSCVDFAWKLQYNTWKVSLLSEKRERAYSISPVAKTNIFVIIRDTSEHIESQICASCNDGSYTIGQATSECNRSGPKVCNCPCHSQLEYEACHNSFSDDVISHSRCTNATSQFMAKCIPIHQEPTVVVEVASPQCYQSNCQEYTDMHECRFRLQCSWCQVEKDGSSGCHSNDTCLVLSSNKPSSADGEFSSLAHLVKLLR